MAKYNGSPFGDISGQQLGVVGSSWKGVKYLRKYTIPNNPNTADQQTQRTKFKNIVDFGRRIVDLVLNTYQVPAPKGMSAFNLFVSTNVKRQTTTTFDPSEVLALQGSLYNPGITGVTYYVGGIVEINWSTALVGEAAADDLAITMAYNETKDQFGSAETVRSAGTDQITNAGWDTSADKVHCWLMFNDAAQTKASDSDYDVLN